MFPVGAVVAARPGAHHAAVVADEPARIRGHAVDGGDHVAVPLAVEPQYRDVLRRLAERRPRHRVVGGPADVAAGEARKVVRPVEHGVDAHLAHQVARPRRLGRRRRGVHPTGQGLRHARRCRRFGAWPAARAGDHQQRDAHADHVSQPNTTIGRLP
jgi:hypothetical protein